MLNVEKYLGVIKSEIDENACASKSCLIAKVRRGGVKQDCDRITCRDCEDESIEWLFSEHEQQLLKNGDGLKPGDWIMVRDCDGGCWAKRQFLFYYNGRFYCELVDSSIGNGEYVMWKQARLLESCPKCKVKTEPIAVEKPKPIRVIGEEYEYGSGSWDCSDGEYNYKWKA